MKNNLEELSPGNFYHVFSRANGNERLFRSDENYRFFLKKYIEYIDPLVFTYSYCLMPNHFHFLIQVRSENDIKAIFPEVSDEPGSIEKRVSKQFSNFLSSYSQAFNKQQGRRGSLFMRPFKRIKITDEKYRRNVVQYIHFNPMESNLCKKPSEWLYSSYNSLIGNSVTFVHREEVMEWFGDTDNFQYLHKNAPER